MDGNPVTKSSSPPTPNNLPRITIPTPSKKKGILPSRIGSESPISPIASAQRRPRKQASLASTYKSKRRIPQPRKNKQKPESRANLNQNLPHENSSRKRQRNKGESDECHAPSTANDNRKPTVSVSPGNGGVKQIDLFSPALWREDSDHERSTSRSISPYNKPRSKIPRSSTHSDVGSSSSPSSTTSSTSSRSPSKRSPSKHSPSNRSPSPSSFSSQTSSLSKLHLESLEKNTQKTPSPCGSSGDTDESKSGEKRRASVDSNTLRDQLSISSSHPANKSHPQSTTMSSYRDKDLLDFEDSEMSEKDFLDFEDSEMSGNGGSGGSGGDDGYDPNGEEALNYYEEEEENSDSQREEFDAYAFIKDLGPLDMYLQNRPVCLPSKALKCKKKSLVLDLDETLVHCSIEPLLKAELTFPVNFNGQDYTVYVRRRPYFDEFLARVAQWFELIVFTASQKVYADKLLDIVDPHRKYIKYRVFRDSCVVVDGNYLKDLTILGRDLSQTMIVDNSPQAFAFQLENGIPIVSWFDDDNDKELLNMIPLLEKLREAKDVRPVLTETFQLRKKVNTAKGETR